jgi:hypothetical protein
MVVINIRSAINFSLLLNMGDWKGGRVEGNGMEDWKLGGLDNAHNSILPLLH